MDCRVKPGNDDREWGRSMIPVVDAHHHIWRQGDLPWLKGPMVPRIFGPYEPIRRDYPIGEYLDDIAGTGVERSVYVQANWPPEKAEDEVAWVQKTADESGWPHAIVGYADLMAKDVSPALDKLKTYPLMRGVRMQLHWHQNEQYRFAPRPDLADDPTFRKNFAALADYGFSFDLQVFASQMQGAARLASDFGGTTFILRGAAERLFEALRARHLHPQERPGTHRLDREGDRRALRRGSLSLRLEFPGREAVDGLSGAARCASRGDFRTHIGRAARRSPRHGGEGL